MWRKTLRISCSGSFCPGLKLPGPPVTWPVPSVPRPSCSVSLAHLSGSLLNPETHPVHERSYCFSESTGAGDSERPDEEGPV